MRRGLAALLVVLAAALAGGALAATADKEQHHFTAADQALAKRALVVKKDLGTSGWTGGYFRPTLTPFGCSLYDPKQSDLVVTGIAGSRWTHAGVQLQSEAQVLQDAQMVRLDWQRTVLDRHVVPCLAQSLRKELSKQPGTTLLSVRRTSFPHVGDRSSAFLANVTVKANGQTVPVVVEIATIGVGRVELTLSSTTAKVAQPTVGPADVRLAKTLAARAKR
jgi:hypothetical protein